VLDLSLGLSLGLRLGPAVATLRLAFAVSATVSEDLGRLKQSWRRAHVRP
jgi:hypothetical protein